MATYLSNDPSAHSVIIGAGLSGLVAAGRLAEAGRRVTLVDKARSIGGRLATRQVGGAHLDHGAQFFTTRSPEFTEAVGRWVDTGLVAEWCRGFSIDDGYPRYRVNGGMQQLPRHLADAFDPDQVTIATRVQAQALLQLADRWGVAYHAGSREVDEAGSIIATAPVPEIVDLLVDGTVRLDGGATLDDLRSITYHKVIALLVVVDGAPDLGPTGARQQPDDPTFTFIADNKAKGISERNAVTFHAAHALSAELFGQSNAAITEALLPQARAILADAGVADDSIRDVQIKQWRYTGPVSPRPERCLTIATTPGPLVLAGDAFAGSKIEGAFLSGLAAADAVLAAT